MKLPTPTNHSATTHEPLENGPQTQIAVVSKQPIGIVGRIFSWAPSFAVYTLLILLGVWGHRTGWNIPRFGSMTNAADPVDELWCTAHSVAESVCVECDDTVLPGDNDFGWCQSHGLHQCPLCHPEIAQLSEPPEVSSVRMQRVSLALSLRDRTQNNVRCPLYRRRIQFANAGAVNKAGVDVEPVQTSAIVEAITANGEITYDETQLARITPRAAGTVQVMLKNVGDAITVGDLIALVDSSDVGRIKSELLDALSQQDLHQDHYERIAPLERKKIVSGKELVTVEKAWEKSKIDVAQSIQALANLGFDCTGLDRMFDLDPSSRAAFVLQLGVPKSMRANNRSNNLLPVAATLSGVVTKREVVSGQVIETSDLIVEVANIDQMWLTFQVPVEEVSDVELGQPVRFLPDGGAEAVASEVDWISTDVDPKTRTVAVRAIVDNVDGKLRSESFGTGQIILREETEAVVVPTEAVQWDGNCLVAFVRDKDYFLDDLHKLFHVRSVRVGVRENGTVEVIAGLLPGEVIATTGSGVLRSQLLRNNLGAGCTCGH